jgi:predicted Zn-dependent protease
MGDDEPREDPEGESGESDDADDSADTGESPQGEELSPEELAEQVLDEQDSAEDPSTESPSEGSDTPSDSDADSDSDSMDADPESGEAPPDPGSAESDDDDELSPEELAEEVLQEDPPDSMSEEERDELLADDPEETEEEIPSDEAVEEPSEDAPEPDETSRDEADQSELSETLDDVETEPSDPDEELTPEELAEEVTEEEPEGGEEPPTQEEGDEADTDQPTEPEPDDTDDETEEETFTESESETQPSAEDDLDDEDSPDTVTGSPADQEEALDETTEDIDEVTGESEEPEQEEPEEVAEQPSGESDEIDDDDMDEAVEDERAPDESSSIQDMLEEEAEKARTEERVRDEEELPEGYLTVEQLPEEDEFRIPWWMKLGGRYLFYVTIAFLSLWYLFLPLWETFLMNQIRESFNNQNYETAEEWADFGTGSLGIFIKNDDIFLADYLKQYLEHEQLDTFESEYNNLAGVSPEPYVLQVHTQFLLNQGRWTEAVGQAETLKRFVETRGAGYLMHGKAALELGQFEQAQADISRAQQWLGRHPGIKRLFRDLNYLQGNYQQASRYAGELQALTQDTRFEMKVDDYLQMARINKKLDKHRVAQNMLQRALDQSPRHRGVMRNLARQYLLEERWQRAEPLIEGTTGRPGYRNLYPFDSFGWWGSAELSAQDENVARSIRLVERAEDLEPRDPEVHRVKGEIYQKQLNEPAEAVREYERARELGLKRLTFLNALASARYQAGQFEGAAKIYANLREQLGDTRPELTYNLGSALLGAGQFEPAEDYIIQAFNNGYRNQNSYNQWGLLLELRGDRQRALAKYFEGIEWAQRNNRPISRVRENFNRALSEESPDPLTEWIAPVHKSLELQPWETLDQLEGLEETLNLD